MGTAFGINLKAARQRQGLTQGDFAERLNTTQQRISEWEKGKVEPSLITLVKILKVLDISFEELIEGYES